MPKKETFEDYYLPRDISWMYFNRRILQEAHKENIPLLERLSFLGIYSNNLDEFFRVRVATQSRVAECEDKSAKKEQEEAKKLLKQIYKLNSKYAKEYEQTITALNRELRDNNIYLLRDNEVDDEQRAFIRDYYYQKLNGFINPTWFSRLAQIDDQSDEDIYMAIKMTKKEKEKGKAEYALLELPISVCGRFAELPTREGRHYLMYMEDVVRCCLPLVFVGLEYEHFEAYSFKFTKDAEMEIDNDLRNGTLQKISKGVKSRKKGEPLRVIYDASMPKDLLKKVLGKLNLDKLDTVLAGGRYQNHRDLMSFPDCGRRDLKYAPWPSILRRELAGETSLFDLIRQKDRYLHVPYHSFDSYIRLLQEAAIHPAVKSVRTTLYRLAKDSKVIKALVCAARNGKHVTVVIELLARFDEASNISWSKRMQDAGINVIFGVEGLKVHSKITHIGFKSGQSIACISTGNFHEGNARSYTDFLLMTAHRGITADVDRVFRFIKRPYAPTKYHELLVSPNEMKKKFIRLIDAEIRNHKAGLPAYIKMKVNHVTDPVMVDKLYEAAAAGVPVDLLVRGNCSLVCDQPQLGGRLRVVGIIDRYLEHSRIYIFCSGGQEQCFIGSADWMPRNLDYRVEVVTPVYDPDIRAELHRVVDYGLRDTTQGRRVDGIGTDLPLSQEPDAVPFRSQEALYNHYKADNEKTPEA